MDILLLSFISRLFEPLHENTCLWVSDPGLRHTKLCKNRNSFKAVKTKELMRHILSFIRDSFLFICYMMF